MTHSPRATRAVDVTTELVDSTSKVVVTFDGPLFDTAANIAMTVLVPQTRPDILPENVNEPHVNQALYGTLRAMIDDPSFGVIRSVVIADLGGSHVVYFTLTPSRTPWRPSSNGAVTESLYADLLQLVNYLRIDVLGEAPLPAFTDQLAAIVRDPDTRPNGVPFSHAVKQVRADIRRALVAALNQVINRTEEAA